MHPKVIALLPGQLMHVAYHTGERLHTMHSSKLIIPADGGSLTLRWPNGASAKTKSPIYCSPDVLHGVSCDGPALALFVEPSREGSRWLELRDDPKAPFHAVARSAHEGLTTLATRHIEDYVTHSASISDALHELALPQTATRRPLDHHVEQALEYIEHTSQQQPALELISRHIHLSPSKLSHLFKAQVGISVKRYLLWRKLHRAITIWAAGPWDQDMTTLAYLAGFSDLAHFSRTAAAMRGQTPSYLSPQNNEQLSSSVQA